MALALSSWLRWRLAASAALIGIFFIPMAFGEAINNIFLTRMGHLIGLPNLIKAAWASLFGTFVSETGRMSGIIRGQRLRNFVMYEPPPWASWLVLLAIGAFCLLLLVRKVRAYEVVR